MKITNQTQWTEVKKVKFHHRVKRFYYKNLFRKIYTVAIVWLIAANVFSIVKYASFADETPMLYLFSPETNDIAVMWTSNIPDWIYSLTDGDNIIKTVIQWDTKLSVLIDHSLHEGNSCPSEYHMFTKIDMDNLIFSRCYISNTCNAWSITEQVDWVYWDLDKYSWDSYRISKTWIWTQIATDLDISLISYQGVNLSSAGWHIPHLVLQLSSNVIKENTESDNFMSTPLCIKNLAVLPVITTYTVTFNSTSWSVVAPQIVVLWSVATEPSPAPTRDEYIFDGWYLTWSDTAFDFTGTAITWNITLYAKWNKCPSWSTYSELVDWCVIGTVSKSWPVYYWTDADGEWLISIKNPSGDKILTMMDKNLWATAVGQVGNLYQRWNNAPVGTTTWSERVVYENYWPWHSFYDTTLRVDMTYDYWENNMHYKNLRWWLEDSSSNNRWWINIWSTRQWPCPAGYHVPSAWEWGTVVSRYKNGSYWDHYFAGYFKLPNVGYILDSHWYPDWYTKNRSSSLSYYSENQQNYVKCIAVGGPLALSSDQSSYPIGKLPVRCFKDSPNAPETLTLTFNENGGSLLGVSGSTLDQLVASWHLAQQPVNPTKDDLFFYKWTRDPAGISIFDFSTPITNNTTLYAQYSICNIEDWYIDDWNGVCVDAATITFNANGWTTATWTIIVISWSTVKLSDYTATKVDYEFIWWNNSPTAEVALPDDYLADKNITLYAIYRKAPSSWTIANWDFQILNITSTGRSLFNILDRNLWATTTWAWSSANISSYGSYYQWWNNYGFANSGAITTGYAQVNASSYGPSNLYNGYTFIVRNLSPYGWDTTNNYNLWWWEWDTATARWVWLDLARRGPCPAWYHIPSTLEWNQARDLRCQVKMWGEWCTSEAFAQDLLLPYAGHRNSGTWEINSQWEWWYYRSSSRYNDNNAYYLNISSLSLNPQQDDRTPAGYSVRCFMNTSNKDIVYNTNGWDSLSNWTAVSRWKAWEDLPNPTHSNEHKVCIGWYVSSWFEAGTKVSTTALSTDAEWWTITLYAKWHDSRCEEWREYDEELWICYEEGAQYLITFEDYDGAVLQSGYLNYKDIPEFTGTLNDRVNYDFVWWWPSIQPATWEATYIAQYTCSPWCLLSNSGACITPGEMVEWEDFLTITVFDPTNPRSWLIIMDRNLWATAYMNEEWKTYSQWYGYYYQWWNNFWFDYQRWLNVSWVQVDASDFWPWNYYNSSVYSNNSAWWDSSHNNNLWWWSGDNASNNRWANQTNPTDRRWPCPEGYHVPSGWEWWLSIKYWGDTTHREYFSRWNGLYYIDQGSSSFMGYFKLPSRGFLDVNGYLQSQGWHGYYWASSPQGSIHRDPSILEQYWSSTIHGFSVRCFSDTYEAPYVYDMISWYECADGYAQKWNQCIQLVKITYHPNGWAFSWKEIDETITVKYDIDYVPDTNIQFPHKASDDLSIQSWWMFAWWYTDIDYSHEWIWLVDSWTRSQTVYAKWLPFNELEVKDKGGNTLFIIMDRNLWAEAYMNEVWKTANQRYWNFYQWWNNFWFANTWTVISGTTQVNVNGYGPNNYYNSSIFIKSNWNWSSSNKKNLWWWEYVSNPDSSRRWPCPVWYHIPDTLEWKAAVALWCTKKKNWSSATACDGQWTQFWVDLKLPLAGERNGVSTNILFQGSSGRYWSSSPLSYNPYTNYTNESYEFAIDWSMIMGWNYSTRASGESVRCFKDSVPIKITYDIKWGDTTFSNPWYITRWWESPTNLSTSENTSRPNSIFGWWYTTSWFDEGTQVLNNEISTDRDITLYAKWTCEDHYHINGNACEKDTFQITWKDGNGNTLKTEMIEYWETPSYSGTTPTKARTPQYTYTFNDTWSPEIQSVTDNATYIAQFDSMVNKYNITFVDEDGETVLKASREYDYGTPAADIEKPADPEKAEDRHYIYTFAWWTPAISEVTEHRTYRATYSSIAKEYEIIWKDGNGNTLKTEWMEYWETPSYSGTTPTKSRTPQYTYTFNNTWNPEIQSVTDNATYTAQFDSTVNQYQIRFVNVDGTQLQSWMVAYWDTPTFTNTLPNNPYHVFMWWEPGVAVVTTWVIYTAKWWEDINENGIYDALENRYRVVVHYIYSKWWAVTWDRVVNDLLSGLSYNIISPVISHYNADKESVSWIITWYDIEATVIYRPNTDINNNGVADEEENLTSVIRKSSEKPVRRKTKNALSEETEEQETHGSATKQPEKEVQNNKKWKFEWINIEKYSADYSREMNEAYQFSYANKITNQRTIQEADIFEDITRIQMAKMLSNYAINVLWQKPDISKWEMKFDDVPDRLNYQYDKGVTTAYQLWIMWINMENNMFRPNDKVTRAEFATALSRMLYDTADGKWKTKYYEPHISKLFKEWIISDTNPDQLEKRWYVMTMLLRGVK